MKTARSDPINLKATFQIKNSTVQRNPTILVHCKNLMPTTLFLLSSLSRVRNSLITF